MKFIVDICHNNAKREVIRTESFGTEAEADDYISSYNSDPLWHDSPYAIKRPVVRTPFTRVAAMNTAFGNPKGNPQNIAWDKVINQCKNIFDEYCELMVALGLPDEDLEDLRSEHKVVVHTLNFSNLPDVEAVRDALCDIQVFDLGAQHLMGLDGDNDMDDVIDGVMTRFVKSPEDRCRTMELHAAKGVTEVYFEGEYPKMVMKSAIDQPDAPKGKFLKSSSFVNTMFRKP